MLPFLSGCLFSAELRYAFLTSERLPKVFKPKVFNASIIGIGSSVVFAELGFPTPWMRGSELVFAELGFCLLNSSQNCSTTDGGDAFAADAFDAFAADAFAADAFDADAFDAFASDTELGFAAECGGGATQV